MSWWPHVHGWWLVPAVGWMVWGNLGWDSSSPLCVASQTSRGWTQLLPLTVLGLSQEESRSCKARRGLGWEVIQHHFCHVLLVKVSQRPTPIRGVEKETLLLDEKSKVKAYCKGACHRVWGLLRSGYRSQQSGTRPSDPPAMGSFFPIEEVALIQNLTLVPIKAGEKCAFQ